MKQEKAIIHDTSQNTDLPPFVLWFKDISKKDVAVVGGKNASLGEMYQALTSKGVHIPNGFALTVHAYWAILCAKGIDKEIKKQLKDLDIGDLKELARIGKHIRSLIIKAPFPVHIQKQLVSAYKELCASSKQDRLAVAIRSSATAEDLPEASFAGQQETFLNIRGEKDVVKAVQQCMASLFTDRAISYRETKGYDHLSVGLSVTIQQMVDASAGASGVMFTIDTESGFEGAILINAAYGLGEYVVKGRVTPDQFYVFKKGLAEGKRAIISRTLGRKEVKLITGKPKGTRQSVVSLGDRDRYAISDDDVLTLAKWGALIEQHYGQPQDIEWVKDGVTGKLCIVQARPETVKTRRNHAVIETYQLKKKGKELLRGIAIGQRIGAGRVRIIDHPSDMAKFKQGDVLVTRLTDPDWEPVMRIASAIITEQGGKTSHAAIVSRELGVPCVVGVKDARTAFKTGKEVTVSCAEGDNGIVYSGILPFEVKRTVLREVPKTKTKLMMNIGDPENAFALSFLPHDGVGLAREEFIVSNFIRIHPLALLNVEKLKDKAAKKQIDTITRGYKKKSDFYVDKLAEGMGRIAAAMYPHKVIIRLSDFKSNEYASLIGGKEFEPAEENPMLGWRGASRYYSKEYKDAFELECQAIKKAREAWGLDNIIIMVPFCRTPEEGHKVLETMASFGLKQGEHGLKVYVMCEIPSNVILAEEFCRIFDGVSIGSNDLTQLTLGVDRDSPHVAHLYDERNPAVAELMKRVIHTARKNKKHISICGQAASDHPEFAEFLVRAGIDSISLNPDTIVPMRKRIALLEKTVGRKGRETNGKVLSLVATFGMVAAGFIGLGAGCGTTRMNNQYTNDLTHDITPAEIRERVTEKITSEKAKEFNEQMTVFKETNFAQFSVSYPSFWQTEHWDGGVIMNDPTTDEYISIFTQLVSHPVDAATKESVTIGGKQAFRYTGQTSSEGKKIDIIEIPLDDKTTIEINAMTSRLDTLLASLVFTQKNTSLDKPTHWDVREKRFCAQMITYARQNKESACTAFPTPCDIPEKWEVCDSQTVTGT